MGLSAKEEKYLMHNLELQLKLLLHAQPDDKDYQLVLTKELHFVLLPLSKKGQAFIDREEYIVCWEFFDYDNEIFNVSVVEHYINISQFAVEAILALREYAWMDLCLGCIQWKTSEKYKIGGK